MEKKLTKREKILGAALELFSQKGYDATTIDEIGDAVGMKGPALYYYFRGKEDLLEGLIEAVGQHYRANFGSADQLDHFPDTMDEYMEVCMKRVDFTIHDPVIRQVRRMLTMEQFRNETLKALATKYQLEGIAEINKVILEHLARKGVVNGSDTDMMAFELTTPVSMLIQVLDREPEKEEAIVGWIRKHFDHFARVYSA
ncbi:MAG: helix-turn-helix domain-containing protein [Lachnospiraceae bacterium]|nr:helix-turn-helix domain-containing protein [Lachnospiraceae bacterium]